MGAPEFWCPGTRTLVPAIFLTAKSMSTHDQLICITHFLLAINSGLGVKSGSRLDILFTLGLLFIVLETDFLLYVLSPAWISWYIFSTLFTTFRPIKSTLYSVFYAYMHTLHTVQFVSKCLSFTNARHEFFSQNSVKGWLPKEKFTNTFCHLLIPARRGILPPIVSGFHPFWHFPSGRFEEKAQ